MSQRAFRRATIASLTLLGLVAGPPVKAQETDRSAEMTLAEAISGGTVQLALRYRLELVDDDALAVSATASTLRTALLYRSRPWKGLSFLLEAENVSDVGAGDSHDNRAFGDLWNGVADRPVIADPSLTQMGQGFIQYASGDTTVRAGRQELIFDNARFVGNVGWRQHHQAFDAISVSNESVAGATFRYAYVDRVHRIFGDRQDISSHLLNVSVDAGGLGKLGGYGYLLDYDEPGGFGLSTNTFGARLQGSRAAGGMTWAWELEYAAQREAGSNPATVRADYVHLAGGASSRGYAVRLGWERLDGDPGNGQFSTPLATLHAFNGWADKFLRTPANGLDDLYARLSGPLGPLNCLVVWHRFEANGADLDYGRELDFQISWRSSWNQTFAFRGAVYDADAHSTDTTKIWLYSTYGF